MSWHFLQGPAAASWEGSCLDGAPSALLRLIPTAERSCSPDSGTEPSSPSPSGMMSAPSTATHGGAMSMSSAEDSPARTSAPQEKAQESTGSAAGYGPSSPASLAKYDPASRSWRTAQYSLLGGLSEFSGTWPRWGMMRNGECWERTMPAHLTDETESGLWPTATCNGWRSEGSLKQLRTLAESGESVEVLEAMAGGSLRPTRMSMWPTPNSRDWKGAPGSGCKERGGRQSSLPRDVGGKLNPDWTEWLMGFPIGWTALEPLAMDRFRKWPNSLGEFSQPQSKERE